MNGREPPRQDPIDAPRHLTILTAPVEGKVGIALEAVEGARVRRISISCGPIRVDKAAVHEHEIRIASWFSGTALTSDLSQPIRVLLVLTFVVMVIATMNVAVQSSDGLLRPILWDIGDKSDS